jgi:micrococcal nuclease
MPAPAHAWVYRARFLRNYDGDTLDVQADLGFDIHLDMRLRLLGVDTPELASRDPILRARARDARGFTTFFCADNDLLIETVKDATEKYGRYLARVWARDACLNDALVAAGLAVPYDGGKRV